MMVAFYYYLNRALDALLDPVASWPLLTLSLSGGVVGVVAMILYKHTSSQGGIKDAKDKIKAHFFEVWLYIDDAPVILRAQAGIFRHAFRYLAFALVPLATMIVIFFPLFANLETRYAYRPLKPGETAIIELQLARPFDDWKREVQLELPDGVTLAAGPVRFIRKTMDPKNIYKEIKRQYVVDYKLRPERAGRFELKFRVQGQDFSLPLLVGADYGHRATPYASTAPGTSLLYPPLVRIPAANVAHVRISYPPADFPFLGWNTWWVWPFLIVSMLAAFAVKGVFKVEI
jgi:hypothetical protein